MGRDAAAWIHWFMADAAVGTELDLEKILGNIMFQIFWDISPYIHFSNSTLDISQISRKVKLQRKPCTLYTSLNIRNHWERLSPWYHKVSLQQIQ
jgi:hypothetical protein